MRRLRRIVRSLAPALLLLLLPVASWSQTADAQRWEILTDRLFFNLSSNQGLPAGRVSGIVQDAEGMIWLVTGNGLVRYDGREMWPFHTGIPDIDNDIRAIEIDPLGQLWLGTGRGVHRFEPSSGRIRSYPLQADESFAVLSIAFEQRDNLVVAWLGSERGVFEVWAQSGEVVQHLQAQVEADRAMRVFSMLHDRQGRTWAGTSSGLFMRAGGEPFERFDLSPLLAPNQRISGLLQTTSGDLWIATPRQGAVRLHTDGRLTRVAIDDFDGEWIYTLAEVAPDVVWLGTYGRGIVEWSSGQTRRFQNHPLLSFSLAHDETWTIKTGRQGLVWIGTGRGASIYDPTLRNVQTAFGGSDRPATLRDPEIKSLLETGDGRLLVGLNRSGVDIVDPVAGRVGRIDVDADNARIALPGGAIEAMAQAPGGDLFIGSNWGLYRFRDQQLLRLAPRGRREDLFAGALQWHNDALWVGGSNGLWRVSPDGQVAEPVAASVSADFTDPRISTLAVAPDGLLVAGTWNGVNWLDGDGNVTGRVSGGNVATGGLENGYITSIVHDSTGQVWLGTSGAGIYRFDPSRKQTAHLGRQDGLPSDQMGSLQIDGRGRIWASSNGGIAVIDPDSLSVTRLGPADGAVVAPYFRQAGLVTRSGEVLFGGDGGLTIIRAQEWQPDHRHSPLVVSSIRVGDARLRDRLSGRSADDPLEIPAGVTALSVRFAALDFLAARSIRYRYRLDGVDRQWRPMDATQGEVSFSSLDPGQYRLDAQASNRHGQWPDQVSSLHFQVLPLWHQTAWARWLGLLAVLMLLALFMRWRTAQLRKRQAELEYLIAERTAELQRSSEALREKSAQLETVSLTDPLTGMHNRRFLEKNLPTDVALCLRRFRDARPDQDPSADLIFFMADLDHFKRVNDRFGHPAGDAVLQELTQRLRDIFRETDYLVRWGGEEFLAIARGTTRQNAGHLAERIRTGVADRGFEIGSGQRISLTCSVGFCALPFDLRQPSHVDWQDLVRLADMALYTAKRAGRDAWVGISAGPGLPGALNALEISRRPAEALEQQWIQFQSNLDLQRVKKAWVRSADTTSDAW